MQVLRPFFICALAVFAGTVLDALVKAIAFDLPVLTLTAWRFLFGSIIVLVIFAARREPMPSKKAIRFHFMRGSVHSIAVLTFFGALSILPLAMATVLGFTAALMVAPIARFILHEPLSKTVTLTAILGFAGAALTVTGFENTDLTVTSRIWGGFLSIIAATAYAMTLVLIRLRARTESAIRIVMFSNVVPAIICWGALIISTVVLPDGPVIWPGKAAFPSLILLAILGVTVWILMTTAYASAEAGRLAPLEYTALIWSAMFGALFFGEVPGWRLYLGAAIIICACLILAVETHNKIRREAKLPASDILE